MESEGEPLVILDFSDDESADFNMRKQLKEEDANVLCEDLLERQRYDELFNEVTKNKCISMRTSLYYLGCVRVDKRSGSYYNRKEGLKNLKESALSGNRKAIEEIIENHMDASDIFYKWSNTIDRICHVGIGLKVPSCLYLNGAKIIERCITNSEHRDVYRKGITSIKEAARLGYGKAIVYLAMAYLQSKDRDMRKKGYDMISSRREDIAIKKTIICLMKGVGTKKDIHRAYDIFIENPRSLQLDDTFRRKFIQKYTTECERDARCASICSIM